ncbi:hypothetical protein DXG01_014736 [Tephrocybe rancida]|nr:hypothetical protein DXG01_014736 [Tephrocybe rancida]
MRRIVVKIFSISLSKICNERTASRLGWFNAAQRSSMSPETLVECTKLYNFYTNSFEEGEFDHKAHVYVPEITPTTTVSNTTPTAQQYSAPSLADLLNKENVLLLDVNIERLEADWFDAADPYDLEEADCADAQNPDDECIVRCSTQWKIADIVTLDSTALTKLITRPGGDKMAVIKGRKVAAEALVLTPLGQPDDWEMDDFI